MGLFDELKRRNVFRAALAYIIVGWLVMQVGEVMAPALNLPGWVMSALAFFLPVALVLAWAFELTPSGIRREGKVNQDAGAAPKSNRRLDVSIMALLALAISFIAWDRLSPDRIQEPGSPQAATDESLDNSPSSPEGSAAASIAVLPFIDMSPEQDQEYFSDGIAEELLNLLVRVDGLMVASRTSSFAYKADTTNIPQIARDLKVSNILEGSVRKSGNRVRITAQLVDALQDRQLWSESYDRNLTDIFIIQEEIANSIVNALRTELRLTAIEGSVRVEHATTDMSAYDLYLRAHARFIDRDELDVAVRLAEEAVEADSAYAKGWELLAAVANVAPGWGHTDRDYRGIAHEAAKTAIGLNEGRSMAWAVLGSLAASDSNSDVAAGIDYMTRAIHEDPKNASAWLWRGLEFSRLGFFDAAARDINRCLDVDPAYLLCLYHLGLVESLRGHPQVLRDRTEQLLSFGFDHHIDQHTLFLGAQGDYLAARLLSRLMPPHSSYPREEFLYALKNPKEDHAEGIQKAEDWLEHEDRVGASMMLFFAFRAWERLVHDDGAWQHWIWSPLHPDFRQSKDFKRLVRSLGLDRYWRAREFPPQCWPIDSFDFECQ